MDGFLRGVELYNLACDLIAQNVGAVSEIESALSTAVELAKPLTKIPDSGCRARKRNKIDEESDIDQEHVAYLLSNAQVLLGKLIEWKDSNRALALYAAAIEADDQCTEAYTQLARCTWQLATASRPEELDKVEAYLRKAIAVAIDKSAQAIETGNDYDEDGAAEEAKKLLIRLLWQNSSADETDKQHEAMKLASSMGYVHILPHAVFENRPPTGPLTARSARLQMQNVCIYNDSMPPCMLAYLLKCFDTASPFWACHGYNSPTTGFFSYQNILSRTQSCSEIGNRLSIKQSPMSSIVHHIWSSARRHMPSMARAQFGEWWAHNRYHSNGHRMHYDYVTNPENPDLPRHPIATCIVYLTDDCGGSTFVTDQTVKSGEAHQAFLIHPKRNRLACFDGRLLHCVVPASGLPADSASRRITLMFAFYETDPGAPNFERLYNDESTPPPEHHSESLDWVDLFRCPLSCNCSSHAEFGNIDNNQLLQLNPAVDTVNDGSQESTSSAKKRKRRAGVDLLKEEKVFTYFQALNSGLVLAKKFI